MNDFTHELAMAYGYNWDFTGINAKNFIVRADFDWEVANQKNFSGCGYVFRQVNNDHYHMIALDGLNGVVLFNVWPGADGFGNSSKVHTSINAVKKTKLPVLGSDPYHATFTVIMNDRHVYVYINYKLYSEYLLAKDDEPYSGPLSYMVLTGASTDFWYSL